MGIESSIGNSNQNKVEDNKIIDNVENKDNNLEKKKSRFERYFEIEEQSILQDRPTVANMFLADLEKELEKAKSEGVDFSSINDFEVRMAKLRMEAGKIAVLSCLEKAKLALKTKEADSSLLASWYFATEEKLEECKGLISSSDVKLIEEEIKDFRTSFLVGVIAHPEDDYNTQKEKELEDHEKKIIQIYEANLENIEQYINKGDLNFARSDFNHLNEFMFEDVTKNKFLNPDLQKRIDDIRKKLEVKN